MSPEENNKNIWPLLITVVLCAVFIVLINLWTRRQVRVGEEVTAVGTGLKEEPEEERITPAEQVTEEEPDRAAETQIEKIDRLLNAQYEVYSKESEEQRTSPSKYNTYPSEEELKEMKRKRLLMY